MLKFKDNNLEIGLDEAGRGCWWGPVYASAVIFPEDKDNELIRDSKKLSLKKRNLLKPWIIENCHFGIGSATSQEIDNLGIMVANKLAMNRALDKLKEKLLNKKIIKNNQDFFKYKLIIDGIGFKNEDFKGFQVENIIKGDDKYMSIASASILAKTARDQYCETEGLKEEYQKYEIAKHKGYGTAKHRELLLKYGNSDQHRKSFKPCSEL